MKVSCSKAVFLCSFAVLICLRSIEADSSLPACSCNPSRRALIGLPLEVDDTPCFCFATFSDIPENECCPCNIFCKFKNSFLTIFNRIVDFFSGIFDRRRLSVDAGDSYSRRFLLEEGPSCIVEGLKLDPSTARSLQHRPHFLPQFKNAQLLADDVGLWVLPDFLNSMQVQELLEAIEESKPLFWDCYEHHCAFRPGLQACLNEPTKRSSVQPMGKDCLLVTDPVKKKLSDSSQAVWLDLDQRLQSLWPHYVYTSPFFVQSQQGSTGSFKYHVDGDNLNMHEKVLSPVSIVIYLTDGGSKTVFPYANSTGIAVTPKAGTAITFYNIDTDNKPLRISAHGVQASTDESAALRVTVTNKYTYAPQLHQQYNGVDFAERASL